MKLKVADYTWEHPLLKKNTKSLEAGEYLFHQGDKGKSMFILIRGIVALLATREKKEYLVDLVESGGFLGEKALMSSEPHERFFSARARTPITVMELSLRDIDIIHKVHPQMMTDLLKQMFQMAALRLDRANQVIAALRSSNNVQRFIQFVILMAEESVEQTPAGNEIFLNLEKVQYYVDMHHFEVEQCVRTLMDQGILIRQRGDSYLLSSIQALKDAASLLEDNLPKLKAI